MAKYTLTPEEQEQRDAYIVDINKTIIENIKKYLIEERLSYGKLADKAGVSQGHLSVYFSEENNNTRKEKMVISLKTLISIAFALNVKLTDLLLDKTERYTEMVRFYPSLAIFNYEMSKSKTDDKEQKRIPMPLMFLDNFNGDDVFIINIDNMNFSPFFKKNDKLIVSNKFFNIDNQKEEYRPNMNILYGLDFEKYYLIEFKNNMELYKINLKDPKTVILETANNNTIESKTMNIEDFYKNYKILGKVIHVIN